MGGGIMDDRGEVVVMSFAVGGVLVSFIVHHLYYEFTSLLLLTVAALFVHSTAVSQYNVLQLFNPRYGTSSGVYMGSLSIPCVQAARLIQQSRIVPTLGTLTDIEDFRVEYWYALVSSASLLTYIWWTVRCHEDRVALGHKHVAKILNSIYWRNILFAFPLVALFFPIKVASFAVLFVTSISLLEYEIHSFPHCASLGEALLVSNGLSLYINNAIVYTLSKIYVNFVFTNGMKKMAKQIGLQYQTIAPTNKDTISAILQGILIGLLFVPWIHNIISSLLMSTLSMHKGKANSSVYNGVSFLMALVIAFVMITQQWLSYVHGLQNHLVIWTINFVFQDIKRLYLCAYWICIISMSVVPFYLAKNTKFQTIMLRKAFHAMVVVMFTPAILTQPKFLQLAFAVALAVFLVVEMIRVLRISPFGEHVDKFMAAFTDSRDSDLLIISHFSLLLGCALPLWLMHPQNDRPLAPLAGVFSLGIGDTMASVIGYNYGSHRLYGTNAGKTVEGLVAGIVFMFLACFTALLFIQISLTVYELLLLALAVICTGLMEAYTTQLDNAFLPLLFYFLLII